MSDPSGISHRRRLFTFVDSPPRVLAAGDQLWTGAFPPGLASITRRDPRAITAAEVRGNYDAVVIDGAPAGAFAPGVLGAIAEAVEKKGAGLFLMNGRHAGGEESPRTATILMSYNDTPLERLLPLVSRPRPRSEAPPRRVVFLIDASGSTAGAPIETEKQLVGYIVEKFLRPQDSVEACAFTTGALELARDLRMTDQGKRELMNKIRALTGDGGTEPEACLALIAGRKMANCGLIFVSDGYFDKITVARPDCRMTAFGVGRDSFGPNDPLRDLADPIAVPVGFNPKGIRIPYFDQREADRYYEPDEYKPLSVGAALGRGAAIDVPRLPLSGSAITSVKGDADLIAVRPKLTDPVLAYRDAGAGAVGEFTTAIGGGWLADTSGAAAVRQWISQVLPVSERRRYLIRLDPQGGAMDLEISLAPRNGRLPAVAGLAVRLEAGGAPAGDVPVRRDPETPGIFRGRLSVPPLAGPVPGALIIRESGPDALLRDQRIALLAPPAMGTTAAPNRESYSYGLNEELLRRIAAAGGGAYDAPGAAASAAPPAGERGTVALWPAVALAGCACYLAAVLCGRLEL